MFDTLDFLQTILPPLPASILPGMVDGAYFSVGINKNFKPGVITDAPDSLPKLIDLCNRYSRQGYNAYMGLCSYRDATIGRKATNAMQVKSLWADIDVGKPNCQYKTFDQALAALVQFRQDTGLKPTYVVKSGVGLHVYWALHKCIDVPTWKQLANLFHKLCMKYKLDVDPPRAEDAASILRMPGTRHQSSGSTVEILAKGAVWNAGEFGKRIVGLMPGVTVSPVSVPQPPAVLTTDSMAALVGMGAQEPTADPYKVAKHCPQICSMAWGGYQQWFLAITVLKSCKGGYDAAHELSKFCPEKYDAAAVDKAFYSARDSSPARCCTFRSANANLCDTCRYRDLLTSPIELYRKATETAPTAPTASIPEQVQEGPLNPEIEWEDKLIPISHKSFKVDERGILRVSKEQNPLTGDWNDKIIHMTDVQMYYKRSEKYVGDNEQPQRTHVFELIYPTGQHTEARYVISDHTKSGAIATWMQQYNIFPKSNLVTPKMFGDFMNAYLESVVNTVAAKEVPTRDRFGWTKYDMKDREPLPCFVIGQRGVTPEGLKPVKIHGKMAGMADLVFNTKGTLENWKLVPKLYRVLDQKAGQFAMCLSFAAPLMRFVLNEARNGLFSLYGKSGRGKSELLRNIASVWGDPMQSFFDRRASVTTRCLKLSKWNNIPATMDEVTDVTDEDMFSLAYTLINGNDKEKSASSGAELLTQGNWSTITMTTANKSFKEAIARRAGDSDATLLRVVELECDFHKVEHPVLQKLVDTVMAVARTNYGLAGQEFLYQLLRRGERILTLSQTVTHWIHNHKFSQEERYMSHLIAMGLQAGRWAVEFGLLDYDMDALEQWVLDELVPANRTATKDLRYNPVDALSQYLMDRQLNTIVVASHKRRVKEHGRCPQAGLPDKYLICRPQRNCTVRYEVESEELYFTATDFSEWCREHRLSPRTMKSELKAFGLEMTTARVSMWAGIEWMHTPYVSCWYLSSNTLHQLGYTPVIPVQEEKS